MPIVAEKKINIALKALCILNGINRLFVQEHVYLGTLLSYSFYLIPASAFSFTELKGVHKGKDQL